MEGGEEKKDREKKRLEDKDEDKKENKEDKEKIEKDGEEKKERKYIKGRSDEDKENKSQVSFLFTTPPSHQLQILAYDYVIFEALEKEFIFNCFHNP